MERDYRHIQKKDCLSNKWPFLEFCKFAHDPLFINYFCFGCYKCLQDEKNDNM